MALEDEAEAEGKAKGSITGAPPTTAAADLRAGMRASVLSGMM